MVTTGMALRDAARQQPRASLHSSRATPVLRGGCVTPTGPSASGNLTPPTRTCTTDELLPARRGSSTPKQATHTSTPPRSASTGSTPTKGASYHGEVSRDKDCYSGAASRSTSLPCLRSAVPRTQCGPAPARTARYTPTKYTPINAGGRYSSGLLGSCGERSSGADALSGDVAGCEAAMAPWTPVTHAASQHAAVLRACGPSNSACQPRDAMGRRASRATQQQQDKVEAAGCKVVYAEQAAPRYKLRLVWGTGTARS